MSCGPHLRLPVTQLAGRLGAMWRCGCDVQNAGCVPLFHRWVESAWQLRNSKRLFGSLSSCRSPTSNVVFWTSGNVSLFFFPLVVTTQFNGRYGGGPPRFGGNRGGGGGKFGNPGDRLRKKQWNLDELPKFEKNFYQQHPDVARRSMVWWRHCCVTVLKMCFPRRRYTCWELRNRQQPLVLTCSHVSILAARGRTIQKGQSHHSQRQRMSKPHHQVSRSRLPL